MSKINFLILSLILVLRTGIFAQELYRQKNFSFPVTHYELKNGLEVIFSEDYSFPLVSIVMTYRVGSMNEVPGKTGLSYLMENLMFQGSANVYPMQHFNFIHRVGGKLNASVSEERTVFYQTVPSNQLALVLWLESDRMKFLEINETNVEQAKNLLLEDIQQRKMSNPYLESFFLFDQILYDNFIYSHPLLGSEEDIRNLTVEDVKSFYLNYYVPNNALLCVTGNINKIKAKELIAKYFETIPKGREISLTLEPVAPGKKAVVKAMEDSLDPSPAFHLGFRLAPPYSNDFYILTIIDYLLLRGQSSRLPKRIQQKEKLVNQLSGGIEKKGDRACFKIFATCNNDLTIELCQKAIFSELEKLKTTILPEEELARSKNMFKRDYLSRFSTSLDRAIFLSESFLALKNIDDLPLELDKYLKVTPVEVIGIINRYFTRGNSTILNIRLK